MMSSITPGLSVLCRRSRSVVVEKILSVPWSLAMMHGGWLVTHSANAGYGQADTGNLDRNYHQE